MFVLLCTSLFATKVFAQTKTVTGRITDDKGAVVPNASVVVKNSNVGTTAGSDGTFTLKVPTTTKTLVVSSVGLGQKEITLGSTTEALNIVLSSTSASLSEVVVTALGISRDRRSLGYATQTVKGDQVANRGAVDVVSALQGKVSGVDIVGSSGSPGASVNINIRGIQSFQGSNQPLFVIDGSPVSNDIDTRNAGSLGTLGDNQPANRALDIDPNTIESINILDARFCCSIILFVIMQISILSKSCFLSIFRMSSCNSFTGW